MTWEWLYILKQFFECHGYKCLIKYFLEFDLTVKKLMIEETNNQKS